jgi:hypothetical protein
MPVAVAEKFDRADPEDVRGCTLFALTQWTHLIAGSVIKASLIAVGEQTEVHFDPCASPGFDCAASSEICIVWMGGYEQNALYV